MGKDLKTNLDALKLMKELELAVAELYRTCNSLWPKDDALWKNLEKAEIRHVETIEKMISIFSERPDSFEPNRLFKPATVRTSISGIRGDIEKLKKGKFRRIGCCLLHGIWNNPSLKVNILRLPRGVMLSFRNWPKN